MDETPVKRPVPNSTSVNTCNARNAFDTSYAPLGPDSPHTRERTMSSIGSYARTARHTSLAPNTTLSPIASLGSETPNAH